MLASGGITKLNNDRMKKIHPYSIKDFLLFRNLSSKFSVFLVLFKAMMKHVILAIANHKVELDKDKNNSSLIVLSYTKRENGVKINK